MGLFDFIGDVIGAFSDDDVADQNYRAQQEANAANIAAVNATNATNLQLANDRNAMELDLFNRGMASNDYWNRNTIQARVADAQAAGIHPLAALGVAGMSGGGGSANFVTPQMNTPQVEAPLRTAGGLGQNLMRAITSNMTKEERRKNTMMDTFNRERAILQGTQELERAEKENKLLDLQIAASAQRLATQQAGPPGVTPKQVPPPIADFGVSDVQYTSNADGSKSVIPSAGVKNAIEDSPMEWAWFWRNNIVPNWNASPHRPDPKKYPLPPGYAMWVWDRTKQAYVPGNRARTPRTPYARRALQRR